MNKIHTLALLLLTGIFACEGPEGPPGIPGPKGDPGEDGINVHAAVFEYVFDFVAPDYSAVLSFEELQAAESDVVLVYLLWGINEVDGDEIDIWRMLPQSEMHELGWLQYNYDFTWDDALLFMEAEFPLSELDPGYTENQVARVVVIPGDIIPPGGRINVDLNDYHAVRKAFGLPEMDLPDGYRVPERDL